MKVFVTGGVGVNGAWVVRRLLAEGHEVVVSDVRPAFELLRDVQDQFAFAAADTRDVEALAELLRFHRIDVVAHLAAIVDATTDPFLAFDVNAQGTVSVLEAARRADVRRVVYTSSKAQYGPFEGAAAHPTYEPITEDYPRGPMAGLRAYGAAKILSEEAGRVYTERFGIEFTALRFGLIYGPGKKARHGPIALHSRMIENAMLGVPTVIESGGDQLDDTMYAKDVAQAIVRAVEAPRLARPAYNIGRGVGTSLRDFADVIRTSYPDASIEIGPGLEYLGLGPVHCVMDISRARAELGYEPVFDLEAGVKDYVESLALIGMEPAAQTTQSRWES